MRKQKLTDTAMTILKERYFLEGETSWDDIAIRVGHAFGKNAEEMELFANIMNDMDFIPNSPALMNAGTSIKSYSACYVLPVGDDIGSIYKFYKDAAIISKSGGGVGANYSKIRGKGANVSSTKGVASGPVSFMKIQDVSTDIIKQGGRRRGANMGVLSCDHIDIEEFVCAKDTPGTLENFNLSVGITDRFMSAVTNPSSTDRYRAVLWDSIIDKAWESAEPGVLFMDTIESGNTVPHLGKLECVNPCGEQPLLPYESCTLGSINLANHLTHSTPNGSSLAPVIDWDHLESTVGTSVLFLNRILDASVMPIPECQDAMNMTRKIGLGIMGLHDMLIRMGVPYDSKLGRDTAKEVMSFIQIISEECSTAIGEEEGVYDGCSLTTPYRRNAALLTIAPTGTLSMIANCSSGCEPYYTCGTVYKTVLDGTTFAMRNPQVEKLMKDNSWLSEEEVMNFYKDILKGAGEINWKDHVMMQGCLQEHVDSSISKTINMPNSATREDIKDAYELAYRLGCKGITVYRDGSRNSQVLSVEGDSEETNKAGVEKGSCPPMSFKLDLPDISASTRYRVSVHGQAVYIIVTEGSDGEPLEVFTKLPFENDPIWGTLCRQLSLSLRYRIPLVDIVKQLDKSVVGVGDMSAKISRVLKRYLPSTEEKVEFVLSNDKLKNLCPVCGGVVTPESGCFSCKFCGWEKCS